MNRGVFIVRCHQRLWRWGRTLDAVRQELSRCPGDAILQAAAQRARSGVIEARRQIHQALATPARC